MLKIIRADITQLPESVDAIVNSADREVKVNFGTDLAIYTAAGKEELLAARKAIGIIEYGEAAITDAFNLQDKTKKIVHSVAPLWKDGRNQEEYDLLKRCYTNTLNLSLLEGLKRVALPVLGSGNNGWPKSEALRIGIEQILKFLFKHDDVDVILVIFDEEIYKKCRKIFKIKSYIKNDDVKRIERTEIANGVEQFRTEKNSQRIKSKSNINKITFLDKLAELMMKRELNISEDDDLKNLLYAGHISQRIFYSIRNSPIKYQPSKITAVRMAFALRLSLEETQELLNAAGYILYEGNGFDSEIISFLERKMSISEVENELEKKDFRL